MNKEFATRDIYLATIIKISGVPLLRVNESGGRGIFVFPWSEEIQKVSRDYFNGELRMDPKVVFETWKTLKSITYSQIGDVK